MDVINLAIAKKIAGSGGGGGGDLLNENGVIKQQHLPENFPYKEGEAGAVFTQEMINNATEYFSTLKKVSDIAYTKEQLWGSTLVITLPGVGEQILVLDNDMYFEEIETPPSLLVSDGTITVVKEDFELDGAVITRGLWIPDASSEGGSIELRLPSHETVTKIGKEYLPEGYPYAEHRVFLPETTPVFNEDVGGFVIMDGIDASMFTAGESYTVNWNGTNYETKALLTEDDGMNVIILGDMGAMQGVPTTGEPFVVMILDAAAQAEMGIAAMVIPIDGSASVTLSIAGETVAKIADKYLPNSRTIVITSTNNAEPSMSYDDALAALQSGAFLVFRLAYLEAGIIHDYVFAEALFAPSTDTPYLEFRTASAEDNIEYLYVDKIRYYSDGTFEQTTIN